MYLGLSTMGQHMSLSRLQRALGHAAATGSDKRLITAELMVHPGHPSHPQEGGCGEGPDDFSQSCDRQHELDVLTHPSVLSLYRQQRVQLCSFRDLLTLELEYSK